MNKRKKRILIVDDDERILESFKAILESKGYSVETAKSAEEGIERIKIHDFDLALLDIKLPGMEGTDLLAFLDKNKPKMVKIMVTGYPSLENAVKSLKHGADAYIMKPVNPGNLLNVVEKKLREQDSY